jgi:rhodanese-related sulfurtransferase
MLIAMIFQIMMKVINNLLTKSIKTVNITLLEQFIIKGVYMKLTNLLIGVSLLATASVATEFKDYGTVAKSLIKEHKAKGTFASAKDVHHALKAKDWIVADVRTKEEWAAAQIPGSSRVGRQAPEKALGNLVLDDNDKFVKDKVIVVCNSAKRAAIEAETFKKMGFSQVKIYDLYSWIDECNPVKTNYTVKKDKKGKGLKFGMYKAAHCK